jgi:hypothetical protein
MTYPYLLHEEDSRRTLSEYFQTKVVIPAFASVIGRRALDFEAYVWDVIYGRVLLGDVVVHVPVYETYDVRSETTEDVTLETDAEGVCLDQLGKVVGEARTGLDDVAYRQAIRLKIRTNRSFGRTQDVLEVALLAVPEGTAVRYQEGVAGRFQVFVRACPAPEQVWKAVARARSGGMYGTLVYTLPEWPDEEVVYATSFYGGSAPTRGVLSSVHGAISGASRLAAAEVA